MWDTYELNGVFDEMFAERGTPRPHYAAVVRRLAKLNPAVLERRRRMADVSFRNQGITFTVYSDQRGVEKIFPFDLVPRIVQIGAERHERHHTRYLRIHGQCPPQCADGTAAGASAAGLRRRERRRRLAGPASRISIALRCVSSAC